jgi:hypothetical protein
MGNACVWRWGGDGWYKDWTEPPPPCAPGHECAVPVGNGAFVGQTTTTDCVAQGGGEG